MSLGRFVFLPIPATVASAHSAPIEDHISVRMNPKDAAQFKKLLLARRAELARGLTPRANHAPAEPDESTLAPASLDPVSTNTPAHALLHALDAALVRVERGIFGICGSCGGEIGTRRLVAFPWATLCLPCQARAEKQT